MSTLEELRRIFAGDKVAAGLGIVIEQAAEELAVCSLLITPEHLNAVGGVQGGVLFTLADFTFAVAANSVCMGTVTLNSTIHYLKAAKGQKLTATASRVSNSKSTCHYAVDVHDDAGIHCAQLLTTGYKKQI